MPESNDKIDNRTEQKVIVKEENGIIKSLSFSYSDLSINLETITMNYNLQYNGNGGYSVECDTYSGNGSGKKYIGAEETSYTPEELVNLLKEIPMSNQLNKFVISINGENKTYRELCALADNSCSFLEASTGLKDVKQNDGYTNSVSHEKVIGQLRK